MFEITLFSVGNFICFKLTHCSSVGTKTQASRRWRVYHVSA
jgi:hypothetical protein